MFVRGSGGPEQKSDLSANPTEKVLPQAIEATNRVLIGNGDYDMIIIMDGTLLAIQNIVSYGISSGYWDGSRICKVQCCRL